jgi:hypothetical protein
MPAIVPRQGAQGGRCSDLYLFNVDIGQDPQFAVAGDPGLVELLKLSHLGFGG